MILEALLRLSMLLQPAPIQDGGTVNLGPSLVWMEEDTDVMEITPEQALERFSQGAYSGPSALGVTLRATGRSTWFLSKVVNTSSKESFIWWVGFTGHDVVDFWLVDGQGRILAKPGLGDHRSPSHKALANRLPNHRLEIPRGSTHYLLYRIQNNSTIQADSYLATQELFGLRAMKEDALLFTIYSMLAVIFVFHFYLFLTMRKRIDLVYASFMLTQLVFYVALQGHAAEYLAPDSWPGLADKIVFVTGPMTLVALAEFAIEFLGLRRFERRALLLLRLVQLTALVSISLWLINGPLAFIKGWNLVSLFGTITIFSIACFCLIKGRKAARLFVLGFSLGISGAVLYILKGTGILPYHPVYHFALPIGAAVETVVLALAIGDRLRILQALTLESSRKKQQEQEAHHQEILQWNAGLQQKITEHTRDITLILTHAKIGLLSITRNLEIHQEYSRFLEAILEQGNLARLHVSSAVFERMTLDMREKTLLLERIQGLFQLQGQSGDMSLQSFPKKVTILVNQKPKFIDLDWSPILADDRTVDRILVGLRDITEHKRLREQAAEAKRRLKITAEILSQGLASWNAMHGQLETLFSSLRAPATQDVDGAASALQLRLHTARTSSESWGFEELAAELARFATSLDSHNRSSQNQAFEQLELIAADYAAIAQPIASFANSFTLPAEERSLRSILQNAMQQADSLARELGKGGCSSSIEIQDMPLDAEFLRALEQALVHLIRNSVDHGLEKPEQRVAKGKKPQGKMEAFQDESGALCIRDDGAGLNLQAIEAKARQQGLVVPEKPKHIAELIFEPGFSTKVNADEISGRGVGMDAVRTFLSATGSSIVIVPEGLNGHYLKFHFAISLPHKAPLARSA